MNHDRRVVLCHEVQICKPLSRKPTPICDQALPGEMQWMGVGVCSGLAKDHYIVFSKLSSAVSCHYLTYDITHAIFALPCATGWGRVLGLIKITLSPEGTSPLSFVCVVLSGSIG